MQTETDTTTTRKQNVIAAMLRIGDEADDEREKHTKAAVAAGDDGRHDDSQRFERKANFASALRDGVLYAAVLTETFTARRTLTRIEARRDAQSDTKAWDGFNAAAKSYRTYATRNRLL